MTDLLGWFNPMRWLLLGAFLLAVVGGGTILVHRYNEGLREEGRSEIRALDKAAAEAQTASNRELGRLAELHLSTVATKQERFFTRAAKEIHDASAPLAACPLPTAVRLRLNAAAQCAISDSASACGDDASLPDAGGPAGHGNGK